MALGQTSFNISNDGKLTVTDSKQGQFTDSNGQVQQVGHSIQITRGKIAGVRDYSDQTKAQSQDQIFSQIDNILNEDDKQFSSSRLDQIMAMPRQTGNHVEDYINTLKGEANNFSTGVNVITPFGEKEAELFSIHTLFVYKKPENKKLNPTLEKYIEKGLLDINKDGQTDLLDFAAIQMGIHGVGKSRHDYQDIVDAPQVNETTVDRYKSMPRSSNENINNYIESLKDDFLDISAYGGLKDIGMDFNDYTDLKKLVNGDAPEEFAFYNLRAQQAFDNGLYDFNNDGLTDERDIEILKRYAEGNKNYQDLLGSNPNPEPEEQEPEIYADLPKREVEKEPSGPEIPVRDVKRLEEKIEPVRGQGYVKAGRFSKSRRYQGLR